MIRVNDAITVRVYDLRGRTSGSWPFRVQVYRDGEKTPEWSIESTYAPDEETAARWAHAVADELKRKPSHSYRRIDVRSFIRRRGW